MTNLHSNVYFIESNIFSKDKFKLVVSKAKEVDVIKAHNDVYIGDEVSDPNFNIVWKSVIYDKNLFKTYVNKLQKSDELFFKSFQDQIKNIVKTVNELESIIFNQLNGTNSSSIKLYELYQENLVFANEFTNFNINTLKAFDRNEIHSSFNNGLETSGMVTEQYTLTPNFVIMTNLFHLNHISENQDVESVFNGPLSIDCPTYNEFIICNSDYCYDVDLFKEIFPEYSVSVYKFPKDKIAEDMLYYMWNKFCSVNKTKRVEPLVEKILQFFDTKSLQEDTVFRDWDVKEFPRPFRTVSGNLCRGVEPEKRIGNISKFQNPQSFATSGRKDEDVFVASVLPNKF